jgi:hypothetical protein
MRFVVKPSKFRKTPLLLKRALGAQKLVSIPGRYQPALDYTQDLFLAFPQRNRYPNPITNVPDSYDFLASFYSLTKHAQRGVLINSSIKTPEVYTSSRHFVVRPLRHFGGFDYRITEDPSDYDPATQYISPAIDKWREYRVLFVLGEPLVILRKKPGPDSGPFDAWNYSSGSYFQTVHERDDSPLLRTSFLEDAADFAVSRDTHLVAADVLIDRDCNYAVTEFNFSPALSISSNIEVITNAFASP